MRNPDQITHNGKLLSDILADHKKWINNETGGIRADLSSADLSSANLRNAIGNMGEVKSLHIEKWSVTYTADVMQIGCQRHPIEMWRKSDPRWIDAMDTAATEWWVRFGPLILALIDASPAVTTGHKESSHV